MKPTLQWRCMLDLVELILGLLLAVAGLSLLSRRIPIPYPILLVLGGLLLAIIPGLPRVRLNPELVFIFFLPPLLYPTALFMPWRDFRANLRPFLSWRLDWSCSPPSPLDSLLIT